MSYYPNACTKATDLGNGRVQHVISIRPIAWDRPTAGGGTERTAIPAGFSATGDAQLPHGREGLLDTRMAERLAGQSPQVHIGKGQNHIRMSALGTNNVNGAAVYDARGNVIGRRFNGALAGTDLEWVDIGHRVEEYFHLKPGHLWQYEVRIDGVAGNLVPSPRGWDLLPDSGDTPVLWAGRGYLFKPDDPMSLTVPVPTTVRVQGGKSIYTYTLPAPLPGKTDWAGWTLEPTWTSQPDATDGKDTYSDNSIPDTNRGTLNELWIKYEPTYSEYLYAYLQFVLTLPQSAQIQSATLTLRVTGTVSPQTLSARCLLADWLESELTYNNRKSGTPWTSDGGNNDTDREPTAQGSVYISAANTYYDITLADAVSRWLTSQLTNNGLFVRGTGGLISIASSDGLTAEQRPKITVVYSLASSSHIGRGRVPALSRGRW